MYEYRQVFETLHKGYREIAKDADAIDAWLVSLGEKIQNDHVAFRTFDRPGLDIEALAAPFLKMGYRETGRYHFEHKRLDAKSFSHDDKHAPRVFISHLLSDAFSPEFNTLIDACVKDAGDISKALEGERVLPLVSYDVYKALAEQSEYAAWVSAFGICANHFTVSVNALSQFHDMPALLSALQTRGFVFNGQSTSDEKTPIQGTPSLYLEQFSTKAQAVPAAFVEGKREVLGAYVEFAKRYNDAQGVLYDGFVTQSADRIFESTFENNAN